MKIKPILYIIILFSSAQILSCKKNNLLTNSNFNIETSIDTILFDTLFTTIGSTTKRFKCYNPNSGTINISNISLQNSTNSPFRINIDGESGVLFKDITILAGDSIFIFVEVTIDPNGNSLPLVVEDQIIFETNGCLCTSNASNVTILISSILLRTLAEFINPDIFEFGKSICVGSPLTTIVVFFPSLVRNILI